MNQAFRGLPPARHGKGQVNDPEPLTHLSAQQHTLRRSLQALAAALVMLIVGLITATLSGCGAGGYAGAGIVGVSATKVTIDAGQSIAVSANTSAEVPVSWTVTGANCSAAACGVLASASSASTTYTAPQGITVALQVALQASVAGTTNARTIAVTVNPAPVISSPPPAGTVGTPYSTTLSVQGGTTPVVMSLLSGTLPAGLTFNAASGLVSGTPTASGTVSVVVQATDASDVPFTVTQTEQFVINAEAASGPGTGTGTGTGPGTGTGTGTTDPLSIVSTTLPTGTVALPYATTLQAAGGTAPYTWSLTAGTLPPALMLDPATGVIGGTPTAAGTANLAVQVKDAAGATATGNFSLTIVPVETSAGLAVTTGTLPNGTVGVPYSAGVGISGGDSPYTCTVTSGSLPAGLAMAANCLVTGTPTAAGTATASLLVTDAANPADTAAGPVTITINPAAALVLSSPPAATAGAPYTGTIGVSGGTGPYSCALAGGTLPTGLSLNADCTLTGTPAASGSSPVTVKATDSSNPANTTTGAVTITVDPAALAIAGTLPAGLVGTPYSAPISISGGTAPYTCSLVSGTVPAGLTLGTNCVITGTPTTAGTAMLKVKTTDTGSPSASASGTVTLTVNPTTLAITVGALPNGTVSIPYSATIGVKGGTAPYNCTITDGTLPPGLTLGAGCVVSGTPTVAGTSNLTVHATDAETPAQAASGQISITISPAAALSLTSPPAATVGTPYTGTIAVSGGTAPYTCTLVSGSVPAGLNLGSGCVLSGTPTAAGVASISVHATDASSPTNSGTGALTITVNPAPATLTVGTPPAATVSTPYTGTIPVTGGTAPFACTLASGTLPAGLTLGTGCVITGTPTTVGSATANITATDAATPANTKTSPVIVTVNPLATLSFTGSLPNAVVGTAYTQTLSASGGLAPYTYAITAGALPNGLALATDGTISGTPTTPGAVSFTITATDSEGTPQAASLPLVLLVTYAPTATDAELNGPYAFLFQGYDDATAGVLTYQTATVGSFTADGAGAIRAGELDANHQSASPTGNTISSHPFLGTYTLGTDGRGFITITTLNTDGTAGSTNTYSVAVKAPVAPATIATQGDLVEFDSNGVAGTRGSGTLLAQDPTAVPTGLSGSYAFGMQGDTPCLVSCGLNLSLFGPVAEVGQFSAAAGAVSGTADANIAAQTFSTEALSGTYSMPDSNGRLALTLATANTPAAVYPTDYAVYTVNANQAFVMSTDKHAAFILLAGQLQLQTAQAFSNASAAGPYVGYENTPTNPGLVNQTLQNVLNLSTATIFQGIGNGAGSCTTNSVTQAGATGLINGLTGGVGGLVPILQGALGTYTYTGTSACNVAANGREVLDYIAPNTNVAGIVVITGSAPPARVAYLYGPNQGFFLETGYAGLGRLEQQTGAPFSVATLKGSFLYGTSPAASLASLNASGTFTADGQGSATAMLDENVGVGTINVLDLGVGGTFPFSLLNASFGTYLFGSSDVIYAISPTRYVLVDTNATTTSPSVALIQ